MKALKDYGIKLDSLKTAVGALNKSGLSTIKVKVTGSGPTILEAFLDALETVPEDKLNKLPKAASKFYADLPQAVFTDSKKGEDSTESGETTEPAGEEITSECPTFKTGWNPEEEDCKACEGEFPNEYEVCKSTVEASAAEKKKKGKGKKKGDGTPKGTAKRSRYGHALNTMSGDLDDMFYVGGSVDDMSKVLALRHDRPENKARAKLRNHATHLANRGLTIEEKDGNIRCKEEYYKGYDASNTEVILSAIKAPKKAA